MFEADECAAAGRCRREGQFDNFDVGVGGGAVSAFEFPAEEADGDAVEEAGDDEEFGFSCFVGVSEDEPGDGAFFGDVPFDDAAYGEAVGVVEEDYRDAGFGGLTEGVVEDGGAVAVGGGGGVVGEGSVNAAAVVVVSCAGGDGGAGVEDDAVAAYELAAGFHGRDRCCHKG